MTLRQAQGGGISHHAVLTALGRHVGHERGVHVRELAVEVRGGPLLVQSWDARTIRAVITDLRKLGQPICGTPDTGYFIAETAEELQGTLSFLRSRAMTSLTIEASLRKLTLHKLLGQMALEIEEAA